MLHLGLDEHLLNDFYRMGLKVEMNVAEWLSINKCVPVIQPNLLF